MSVRVQLLGATRLTRVVLPFLLERGRARVVAVEPGAEHEEDPWFAPVRGLCHDNGVKLGRAAADLVLDLDPDARPVHGEGPMIRVIAPEGARSPHPNRALLSPGDWAVGVLSADGKNAWKILPVTAGPDDDAASLLEQATLRGVEALAESLDAVLAGGAPEALPRPLIGGRFRAQETFLTWEQPAARVVARVRACAGPFGGARAHAGETPIWLQDAAVEAEILAEPELPGTVLSAGADGLVVACGSGSVRVRRLRPGWRPVRAAGSFAAEVGLGPGYMLS